mgnify:CR=1 FL=1
MEVGVAIGLIIGAFVLGAVGAFFLTRYLFKKQLQKNPPINEKMIRVMFAQMGRTPSEKQIREIMRNVNSQNK